MKKYPLFCILLFMSVSWQLFGQDSVKVRFKPVINVQQLPNMNQGMRPLKADSINGLWIQAWGIDEDTTLGGVTYIVRSLDKLASISTDKLSANTFYVTPHSARLKKAKNDIITLEIWVKFGKENVYYPQPKISGDYLFDKNGVIPEKANWVPMKTIFTYKEGMYLYARNSFRVK